MPKRSPLTVDASHGRNVVNIRQRETKLQERNHDLTREVARLRALLVAQAARKTDTRTQEIVHNAQGELAMLRAQRLASASLAAPVTAMPTNLVAPSPSRTT